MTKHVVAAMTVLMLVACMPPPEPHWPSRAEDIEPWAGVGIIELETHEKFSTMQRETRELSDGTAMWTFPECQKGATHCRGGATAIGNSAFGGSTCESDSDRCCYHQFTVKDGKVLKYTPRGPTYQCRSNCRTRPASAQSECLAKR